MAEYAAFGTILAFGNNETPSEEYTKLAQVKDISGPSITRDTIDVTNHGSPSGYSEFLASLKDGGEVTFDIEYDPADPTHDDTTGVMALIDENTPRNWRLIFPVAAVSGYHGLQFKALVTGFQPAAPVKGSLTSSITLKVAGAVAQGDYPVAGLC